MSGDELLGLRGPRDGSFVGLETGAEVGLGLLAGVGDAGDVVVAQEPLAVAVRRGAPGPGLGGTWSGAGCAAGVTEGSESLI